MEAFMRRAIECARHGMRNNAGGPFGAVIVRNGEVIGEGWNTVTSSNDPTAHAEINAIRQACAKLGTFELSGCEIYTTCEPCPMCLGAIYWARLAKIYYACTRTDACNIGFDDDFIYTEFSLPQHKRSLPLEPLLREEALALFEEWSQKPDKTNY